MKILSSYFRALTQSAILALLLSAVLSAQSVNTGYGGNNISQGNMFDVKALADLTVDTLDVHVHTATPVTIEVYGVTGGGSFNGLQGNSGAWTLLATVPNLVSAGIGVPTPLNLNLGITMTAGQTQGFYVTVNNTVDYMRFTSGVTTGSVLAATADMEVLAGNFTQYLFNGSGSNYGWNGTVHYTLTSSGLATDLRAIALDTPISAATQGCNNLTANEAISFRVRNNGTAPLPVGTTFVGSLNVNGTPTISETFVVINNTLNQFDDETFSFLGTLDLSGGGQATLDLTVVLGGDLDPSNDTATKIIQASAPGALSGIITTLPWSEDFETFGLSGTTSVANGWVQDDSETVGTYPDWFFNVSTSSSNSGPETNGLGDHTSGSGRFAHIEDSAANNTTINLLTPCLDVTNITNPQMFFFVNSHDYNGTTTFNPLFVDVITPAGITTAVASVTADTGDTWQQVIVDLNPFKGQTLQVQFRGTNTANAFYCDTAIDDVSIVDFVTLMGQAAQAGIAGLDINNATNANGAVTTSFSAGPFDSTTTAGGTMNFTLTGEPNNGLLLISGNLNPQVATFPPFGQFDIGGLPLNAQGIPGGLFLWADGITQPLLGFNQLFNTGPSGSNSFGIGTPFVAPGVLTTFQCIMTHSTATIGFSNAVTVTVM